MTRQRQLILAIIEEARDHPTAQQIFDRARQKMPSIALGTVYRNLGLLADSGEVRRIVVPGQPERYDRVGDPHDHIVCARCGRIVDVRLFDLRPAIEKETGLTVLSYELQVSCICPDCTEKASRPKEK